MALVDVATLGLKLDSQDLRQGVDNLKKVEQQGNRTADSLDRVGKRSNDSLGSIVGAVRAAQAALASLGVGLAIRQVVAINDEYDKITGRLRLVTDGTAELARVEEELFGVAQRTGQAYAETADLYGRVARNAAQLGLTQEELLAVTEATNQAIQIGGASTQEAAAGLQQFSQALASGELRGDEFRSVMENMPRLAQALADSMGVTLGELRKMAAEGELDAKRVTKALLDQSDELRREFESLPVTVGRAMTELENEVKRAIAGADTQPLVDSIRELTETVSDPELIEGLSQIAGGLITIGSAATQAVAGIGLFIGELKQATEDSLEGATVFETLALAISPFRKLGLAKDTILKLLADDVEQLGQASRSYEGDVSNFFAAVESVTGNEEFSLVIRDTATGFFEWGRGAGAAAQGTAELSKEVANFRQKLEEQIKEQAAVLQLTREGIELEEAQTIAKLRLGGATEAQIKLYLEQADAIQAVRDAARGGVVETPYEYDAGDATGPLDAYLEESRLFYDALFDQMERDAESATDGMSVYAERAAQNMQDSFAEFLFDPFEDGVDGMLRNFTRALQQMAAQAAASQIFESLAPLVTSGITRALAPANSVYDINFDAMPSDGTGPVIYQPGGKSLNPMPSAAATGAGMPVTVNLTNQTSTPAASSEARTRMTPQGLVIDIVLRDLNENGPIRQTLAQQGLRSAPMVNY